MKINWNYPTTVWFGEGRIKDLHIACRSLKIKKPLFVTDQDLVKTDLVKNIINDPNLKNLLVNIFSNIKGNPVGSNVDEGVKVFKNGNHDGVIAFGGGSGLDVGKAIAFMSAQTKPIWDFEDVGDNWTKANNEGIAPIIAVPTTAGTGSETGRASLITNEKLNKNNLKDAFYDARVDAGFGLAYTFDNWGPLDMIKPITIRFDIPLFLNRPPATDDFLQFRWILGINRAF